MLYAAYGSNINLEQMKFRCPNNKVIGKGYIKDYKLAFNYHADIILFKGSEVPVLFWEIDKEDWKNLDRYEGYPNYYVKQTVKAVFEDKEIECIVYVMTQYYDCLVAPSYDYFNTILCGYEENKMDCRFLIKAVVESLNKNEMPRNCSYFDTILRDYVENEKDYKFLIKAVIEILNKNGESKR